MRHTNASESLTRIAHFQNLEKIRNWTVQFGHFYTDEDVHRMARVCLLGQTVCRKLFPNRDDPTGETIRIGHVPLQVIGVLAEKGRSPTGADQDDQIFVPISTLQHLVVGEERLGAMVRTQDGFELAEVDLDIRGEGTIMGERQKGRNDLKLASLRRDRESSDGLNSSYHLLGASIA